jgi:hypothetical protein
MMRSSRDIKWDSVWALMRLLSRLGVMHSTVGIPMYPFVGRMYKK